MNQKLVWLNTTNPTFRLILLHGWGADANDLLPIAETIRANLKKKVDFLLINAPNKRPEGIGRQWYGLFPAVWEDVPFAVKDLKTSINSIASPYVPLEKTVLMGFSQGGAMALSVATELPLAGVIACSSYPHKDLNVKRSMPPVLLTHGSKDELVPIIALKKIEEKLKEKKCKFNSKIFNGGHEIPSDVLDICVDYLELWFCG